MPDNSKINSRFRLILLIFTIFYMGLVAMVSLLPSSVIVQSGFYFSGMDKWVHGIMYCFLAIQLFFLFPKKTNITLKIIIFFTFTLAFVYSLIIEMLQEIIESLSRSFEWWDLAANAMGAITGIFLVILIHSRSRKKLTID